MKYYDYIVYLQNDSGECYRASHFLAAVDSLTGQNTALKIRIKSKKRYDSPTILPSYSTFVGFAVRINEPHEQSSLDATMNRHR